MEDARFRKRAWNRTKLRLPKHTSQPELQLLHQGRPRFQCQDCGFVNTLFPSCLWCPWNPKGPEHKHKSTTPRTRRASAPARKILVVTRSRDSADSPLQEDESVIRLFKHGLGYDSQDGFTQQGNMQWSRSAGNIASSEAVATATRTPSVVFALAQTTKQGEAVPPTASNSRHGSSRINLRDSILHSPLSEELPVAPSVDRSLMTSKKRSRTLRLKGSHQPLTIDIHDTNMMPSSASDDDDTLQQSGLILNNSVNPDGTKPSSPPNPDLIAQQQRTLRRRKHLNVLQTSVPDSSAAEPIAISLNLHPSSTHRHSKTSQSIDEPQARRHSRSLSQTRSVATDSSDPTTPPQTPTLIITLPTSAPGGLASNSPGSSPVRLGHPSRPYYSAIRKNGISPSASRPTSVSGPSPTASSRPQSYTPPSSLDATTSLSSTTASRHLSMSAMFVTPPCSSSPPGVPSAFSVMDDVDNDEDESMPILPPTPAPGRSRFSLSSDRRRFSHGPILNLHTSPPTHTHSQSLSQVRSKGPRGSVGFSMSGETELRMALAAGAASAGTPQGGFRFRETVVPPIDIQQDVTDTNIGTHPRRNSFMGRVRKLRQGLKEILLMTSTTSTTTTS
ncbi:hypothetical protein CVT25_006997 [Psilocybe cyanescens]|uniref:Uncharacterized protein n=1 Tax=Psilocybe cyanescens TaxID=93625 RepID=A0A409WYD7_PSICY|nr:hypothetical protein CVT25_006997 [Psilocybe cyanescens]